MYFSLALSLVSAGFAIATTDRTFDTGKSRRKTDPLLVGYVSSLVADGAYRQLLAMVVFFASFMASKMFALGLLIVSANRVFVPLWLVAEHLHTFPWRSVRRSTRRTGGGGRRNSRSGSMRSSRRLCVPSWLLPTQFARFFAVGGFYLFSSQRQASKSKQYNVNVNL